MNTEPNPNPAPAVTFGYAPDPRPKWKRVLSRLWPYKHHFDGTPPDWAKDVLYGETVVSLSFADRLRVLVSGRLRVRSATLCEHVPGKTVSTSIAHPLPPLVLENDSAGRIWGRRESDVLAPSLLFGAALFSVAMDGGLPAILIAVAAIVLLAAGLLAFQRLPVQSNGFPPRPIPPAPPRPTDEGVASEPKTRTVGGTEEADAFLIGHKVVEAVVALQKACREFDVLIREIDPTKEYGSAKNHIETLVDVMGTGTLNDVLKKDLVMAFQRKSAASKLTDDERAAAVRLTARKPLA